MTETILNANDFRQWFIRGFYVLTTSDDSPPDLYIRASEMCKRKALWIIQYTAFHLVSLSWITASPWRRIRPLHPVCSAITAIRSFCLWSSPLAMSSKSSLRWGVLRMYLTALCNFPTGPRFRQMSRSTYSSSSWAISISFSKISELALNKDFAARLIT